MKSLTFRGKNVYTSNEVVDLCEISKTQLYNYSSGSSAIITKGEDFVTLQSGTEREEFFNENPEHLNLLNRGLLSLYYDSAVDKIIHYRESWANSPRRVRTNRKQNQEVPTSLQSEELKNKEFIISDNQQVISQSSINKEIPEEFNQRESVCISNNYQLEILSRLVIRLDEDNKILNNRVFQLESELREIRKSNIELTKLLQEYISLKNKTWQSKNSMLILNKIKD